MRNRAGGGAECDRKGCEGKLTSVAQRDEKRKCSGGSGGGGGGGGGDDIDGRPNPRSPPPPPANGSRDLKTSCSKIRLPRCEEGGERAPTRTGRRRRGEGRGSGWSRLRKWERVF